MCTKILRKNLQCILRVKAFFSNQKATLSYFLTSYKMLTLRVVFSFAWSILYLNWKTTLTLFLSSVKFAKKLELSRDHYTRKLNFMLLSKLVLKFMYSEKATKFCDIFNLLLSYLVPVKSKVKISQNFVAFSEYTNFIKGQLISKQKCRAETSSKKQTRDFYF